MAQNGAFERPKQGFPPRFVKKWKSFPRQKRDEMKKRLDRTRINPLYWYLASLSHSFRGGKYG